MKCQPDDGTAALQSTSRPLDPDEPSASEELSRSISSWTDVARSSTQKIGVSIKLGKKGLSKSKIVLFKEILFSPMQHPVKFVNQFSCQIKVYFTPGSTISQDFLHLNIKTRSFSMSETGKKMHNDHARRLRVHGYARMDFQM